METNPIPNIFFRIAGVISIISAILMIAGFFLHPSGEDATYGTDPLWVPAHALLWIVFIIALPAWVGIYIVHASKAGKIGTVHAPAALMRAIETDTSIERYHIFSIWFKAHKNN